MHAGLMMTIERVKNTNRNLLWWLIHRSNDCVLSFFCIEETFEKKQYECQ